MPDYAQSGRNYSSRNKNYDAADRKIKWHWSLNVLIAGGILGGILMLAIITFTKLSYAKLFLFVAIVGILGTLLQWKKFHSPQFIKKYFRVHIVIFLMYNFFGLGFGLAGTGLLVNWMGASGETIEKYRILGRDDRYVWDSNFLCPLLLENDAYADNPEYRMFEFLDAIKWEENPILNVVFSNGLFGLPVYKESRMMPDLAELMKQVSEAESKETEPLPPGTTITADSLALADSLSLSDTLN